MRILFFLFLALLLTSCGGGNGESANKLNIECNNYNFVKFSGTNNSIKLKIQNYNDCTPITGVIVQLDDAGENILSNSVGEVIFENLTGIHDLHIFSPDNYEWRSFYNLNVDSGVDIQVTLTDNNARFNNRNTANSAIKFSGVTQNMGLNSYSSLLYFSDLRIVNRMISTNDDPSAYNLQYNYKQAINTPVNTELWALKHETDPATNITRVVDAVLLRPPSIINTSALDSKTNDIITDIVFGFDKKPKSLLLNFKSVTVPAGLSVVNQLDISGSIVSSVGIGSAQFYSTNNINVAQGLITDAYISPFKISGNNLRLIIAAKQGAGGGASWSHFSNYPLGSKNIEIVPIINIIPTLPPNQNGLKITWDPLTIPVREQSVTIDQKLNNGLNIKWGISVFDNKNEIVLPTIPPSMTPLLTVGTEYDVYISGWLVNQNGGNRIIESYGNNGVWQR